ncbi:MAG: polysaccharide biosynthesis protein [bacterium]|nr:polysaccharide biosynthesis protein [bacterium]
MNNRRKIALAAIDFCFAFAGLLLALGLRLDFDLAAMERYCSVSHFWIYGIVSIVTVASFYLFGMYEKVWRYAGIHELVTMVYAVAAAALPFEIFVILGGGAVYPRTSVIIAGLLWLALSGGIRFMLRLTSQKRNLPKDNCKRALIVGANDVGEAIVRDLMRENSKYIPSGFIDDDPSKKGLSIHNIPVLGTIEEASSIVREYQIDELILGGLKPQVIRRIVEFCSPLGVKLRVVPSTSDVIEGNVTVNRTREVRIEDLLERDPHKVDVDKVSGYLSGKCILVTGAGGSIGSEICRQVIRLGAGRVILMGRGENSIYEISMELREHNVESFICNLRDRARMEELFNRFHPQVVFHAAAHKHVPLMELNPSEAVSNNIFGTRQLLEIAAAHNVEKLIIISTDKAVNPSSVMGASKRMAELLMAEMRVPGFAAVRFGNVLGSRGSVIPTFKRQIAQGGPVTVTDANMTRFFMTIPEAVSLVIEAGAMAKGGEIYILDMGEPVRIVDLARNMIRLSGFEPDIDIPIKIVGLRPGEKLYEELVNSGEDTANTEIPRITRVTSAPPEPGWPGPILEELRAAADRSDDKECLRLLKAIVPHYAE